MVAFPRFLQLEFHTKPGRRTLPPHIPDDLRPPQGRPCTVGEQAALQYLHFFPSIFGDLLYNRMALKERKEM